MMSFKKLGFLKTFYLLGVGLIVVERLFSLCFGVTFVYFEAIEVILLLCLLISFIGALFLTISSEILLHKAYWIILQLIFPIGGTGVFLFLAQYEEHKSSE